MNLIPLLTTIIFVATIVTIVFAIGSYVVFKARDRGKKKGPGDQGASTDERGTLYFDRYVPPAKQQREEPQETGS